MYGYINDFDLFWDSQYIEYSKNFINYIMSYRGRKKQLKRLKRY